MGIHVTIDGAISHIIDLLLDVMYSAFVCIEKITQKQLTVLLSQKKLCNLK